MSFPCGRQHRDFSLYQSRSLWSQTEQINTHMRDDNTTINTTNNNNNTNWLADPDVVETEEELVTVNSTSGQRGSNETELIGEEGGGVEGRIVGGVLEKPGRSPWQVLIYTVYIYRHIITRYYLITSYYRQQLFYRTITQRILRTVGGISWTFSFEISSRRS